jgi:hypothetical protein
MYSLRANIDKMYERSVEASKAGRPTVWAMVNWWEADAIMKAIRGGTFDTTVGKWTMSGAQTYGSPVVFGTAAPMCTIQGGKEVYLSEHPMEPLP